MKGTPMTTKTKKKQATEWTDEQYDKQRKDIEAGFELRKECADAWRDQRVATLFDECGWTQERIAKREDKTQGWVQLRLRFSRFLGFINTTGINGTPIPRNLTERRFRSYWEQTTKGHEPTRFRAVADLMAADLTLTKPRERIHDKIMDEFGDWEWRTTEEIVERTGFRRSQVIDCLNRIHLGWAVNDAECDRRLHGPTNGFQWRLRKTDAQPGKIKSPQKLLRVSLRQMKDHLSAIYTMAERNPTVTCNSKIRQEVAAIRDIVKAIIDGPSA